MSERDKIIDKIKKCLALSASSNEHEAEAALRQARKLMDAHGVTDLDILAAEADERRARAGAATRPSNWETALASRVGKAFGCQVIFASDLDPKRLAIVGHWMFIGCGASPEIAHYAFAVLFRQCKRAREEHIKARLKRCKTGTKTRRADLFCEGWVQSVVGKIAAFACNSEQTAAIDAYVSKKFPALKDLASRDRNDGRKLRDHEHEDYWFGKQSGKDAQLNRGVGGSADSLALEQRHG